MKESIIWLIICTFCCIGVIIDNYRMQKRLEVVEQQILELQDSVYYLEEGINYRRVN